MPSYQQIKASEASEHHTCKALLNFFSLDNDVDHAPLLTEASMFLRLAHFMTKYLFGPVTLAPMSAILCCWKPEGGLAQGFSEL